VSNHSARPRASLGLWITSPISVLRGGAGIEVEGPHEGSRPIHRKGLGVKARGRASARTQSVLGLAGCTLELEELDPRLFIGDWIRGLTAGALKGGPRSPHRRFFWKAGNPESG
jgi:hypothetical protein